MLKVFLVEDEVVVREALRNNIPWQQYGYRFVGEAGDGEMALPLIRKNVPDLLITDIRMPFMDGLALSHIVKNEYPDMKIIIISGYDEFDYARQAISEGVDEYLLKPVTRRSLQKALEEIREKIEADREQKNSIRKFESERQQYEQYAIRSFFETAFAGKCSARELYDLAAGHGLSLSASGYNMLLLGVEGEEKREAIWRYFLRFPDCLPFRWNMDTCGVLLMGDVETLAVRTRTHLEYIASVCGSDETTAWHVAAGTPVERLSQLAVCYKKVNRIYACRYRLPQQHVLTEAHVQEEQTGQASPAQTGEPGDKRQRHQEKKVLSAALDYIEENYTCAGLGLNEVAGAIGVSPSYFSGLFSQEMDMTFVEYVTQKRIGQAKILLREKQLSPAETAAAVGYRDAHYFGSVFKKTVGMSPRAWRSGGGG
jgi:two-component system response regulator YesN